MPRAEMERRLGSGERYVDIADHFGVERWTVRRRALGFGLEARRSSPQGELPSADGLALVLKHADIPLTEIARAFGVRVKSLKAAARAHGLPTDVEGRAALGGRS